MPRGTPVMIEVSFSTISFWALLAVQNEEDPGSLSQDPATRTRKPKSPPDCGNFFLKLRQGHKVWCRKCNKEYPSGHALWEHQVKSSKHFMCRRCRSAIDFNSEEGLHRHYITNHSKTFCTICNHRQKSTSQMDKHLDEVHNVCYCGEYFDTSELRKEHWATSEKHTETYCHGCEINFKHRFYRHRHLATECANPPKLHKRYQPDYYGILGIDHPSMTQEELLKVAKQKRIDVHPDRLKRQEGLSPKKLAKIDTIAKEIGEAAVSLSNLSLSNPKERATYDRKVAVWEASERAKMYAQQGLQAQGRVQEGW